MEFFAKQTYIDRFYFSESTECFKKVIITAVKNTLYVKGVSLFVLMLFFEKKTDSFVEKFRIKLLKSYKIIKNICF